MKMKFGTEHLSKMDTLSGYDKKGLQTPEYICPW